MDKIEQATKEIEIRMKAVAEERDKLDDLIGELVELKEGCEEAYDCLQRARDALSELV